MRLRVIDIETTGEAPPAEIIEFGRVDVHNTQDGWRADRVMARLYRPRGAIPPETMAVHHITEKDFNPDTPVCSPERLRQAVWGGETPDVLVAHNCGFEQLFVLVTQTDPLPWICTYKVALHLWPEAPKHSNQVLRYWLGLDLDAAQAMPPHRAGPDAWVTAHLLLRMLEQATVVQMIRWTAEPKQLPAVPFGKHRGVKWADVPADYLQWLVRQIEMDPDVLWCARQETERRGSGETTSRPAAATSAEADRS
jgi:exodeoxyribonuclease X